MKCKLSEFGECEREFAPGKPWAEFCCVEHRKRWHYLQHKHAAVENAEARRDERMNGHANGHAAGEVRVKKIDLATLGLAPKVSPVKRRKLKPDAEREEQRV